MSHLSNQGSNQANSWANSRREAIEKAQKLRDDRKYGLAMTGEMTMGSLNPKDKNATMTSQGSTNKSSRLGQTGTTNTGLGNTHGYKKAMTATYDYSSAKSSVPHEEHQQAVGSLRLLKAKMSGGRSNTQDLDQLDAFAGESAQPRYSNLSREQDVKKDAYRQDNVKRQPLDEGSHQNNQNYRKIFKPNFDNDTKSKELPGQSAGYNKGQPSRAQASKQGGYLDERQLKTIPMVHDDEDEGFSSHNIPSRIPTKSTAGQTKGKMQYEDNYIESKTNDQMGGKTTGAKRIRDDQPVYGDESPMNEYRPASKQQYQPPTRQQEKVYDPSQYLANAPGKGPSTMDSYKPKPSVQKAAPKQTYQSNYRDEDMEYERKPRHNQFEDDEENAGESEELEECPEGCGRKFFPNVLVKHAKVCRKVFQSKRKAFDMASQRQTEDQAKLTENKPASKFNPNRTGIPPTKAAAAASNINKPLSKKAKWKAESEAFRANLKAARGEQLTKEEQVTVSKKNDDYVQCDYCARKFNEEAAKRHIPFCQNKHKMDAMKRGPPPKGKTTKK